MRKWKNMPQFIGIIARCHQPICPTFSKLEVSEVMDSMHSSGFLALPARS
jgi:hypothetical protein